MSDLRDPEQAERLAFEAPEEHLRRREFLHRAALTAGLSAGVGMMLGPDALVAEAARRQRRSSPLPSPRNMPVDTFVVLMMENRSFDHYLGWMPEADGRQASLSYVDRSGKQRWETVAKLAEARRRRAELIAKPQEQRQLPPRGLSAR